MTDKELEKIYNEAYRAVYWTAFSLLKNEDDAQDIVQDTFVSLINSYDSIKDKTKVLPWLKKVAANKSLNRLTRTKTDTVEDEFFDSIETVPEDFLPDSLVESAETRKIIMDIINNSLSEDTRRTLILFYFDEMSTKEVAQALGIPEGTVSRRIHSAKAKIKKEVEKYEKENDTKLFMVVPFLTQLFTKEAEQVAFKPIPASLLNLSASTGAATEAAGSKLASQAIKKGTEVTMKKTIITIVSIGLAGAATAGIVFFATRKDNNSGAKKNTGKNADNEITEIDPEDQNNGVDPDGKNNADNDSSAASEDEHYYKYFVVRDTKDYFTDEEYVEFTIDYTQYSLKEAAENVEGEIIIPDGVTKLGFTFTSFDKVTKVVFPEGMTFLPRNCFSDCESIEEVVLPDSIDTLKGYSFYHCYNLHKVVMPKSLKHISEGGTVSYDMDIDIYFPAEVELETYNSETLGTLFTNMPFGSKVTVHLVKGSWMDTHFKELYIDESSSTVDGVYTNYPKVEYWDGVNT